ncbi:unnamed protein product [Caenorhabditis angaria]|uniref:Coiled-coil domain-containing protein 102A n=1 Tax=Caenorhabditis angaria TaxID=860376 RepID=A0A9P1I6R0_9PELO|nr:unnamed protein product [Caenorhabditis angaria]
MADSVTPIGNRYIESNDSDIHFLRTWAVRRCQHTDWDVCERIRLVELQEARDRAAQMEKTMRWWSNCTAEWRNRWSAVRDERNRAREEAETLRYNYDLLLEEREKSIISSQESSPELELRPKLHVAVQTCENAAGNSNFLGKISEIDEQIAAETEFLKDQTFELQKAREKIDADSKIIDELREKVEKMERELQNAGKNKRASSS